MTRCPGFEQTLRIIFPDPRPDRIGRLDVVVQVVKPHGLKLRRYVQIELAIIDIPQQRIAVEFSLLSDTKRTETALLRKVIVGRAQKSVTVLRTREPVDGALVGH